MPSFMRWLGGQRLFLQFRNRTKGRNAKSGFRRLRKNREEEENYSKKKTARFCGETHDA